MRLFWIALFGLIALAWGIQALRLAWGCRRIPRLTSIPPTPDADCPPVSILFTARDEAATLPQALATLLALDYPRFQVVAVDDRSTDGTTEILREFARRDPRLRVVRVSELPPGWLGKPHGLQTAYARSDGEWLVFTDADVRFAPDALRRAVALVRERGWDHLTLLVGTEMVGFWERTAVSYFALGFLMFTEVWRVERPASKRYVGVGAFQMLSRRCYEAVGCHRPLALEVVEDVWLGRQVKRGGFRSGVALAETSVRVRWQEGLGNIVRGTTKNFFAGAGYSLPTVLAELAGVFLLSVLPFAALPGLEGVPRLLAALAALLPVAVHGVAASILGISPLYGVTHPLGAILLAYMLARSTVVTLWRGGVTWRGTFYPLHELRRARREAERGKRAA
ncbi:MAG: glycosyltransferase family 2 protein [Candidatus Methylomirabilota bacterium]